MFATLAFTLLASTRWQDSANDLPLVDTHGNPPSVAREVAPGETHLSNLRQLTFGGQNAEAYWNADGTELTYQTKQPEWPDEQIVRMNIDGSDKRLISTGLGRCTCSYFTPDGKWIYFSSTHQKDKGAQPPLDFSKGYVWMINPSMSMYRRPSSGGPLQTIVDRPGYVAETTIAPNGKYMVFTAAWDGNINIYRSDLNGKHIKPLVDEEGYNGGPFISWDSRWIVYRRSEFEMPSDRPEFHELLKQNLVRPLKMELWIMDANGGHKRQLTHLGCASFAPFMCPDGKRVIFSSNYGDPKGREFDLFLINLDGTGLERVTHSPDFDGFPMFTRDGKHLAFASNRYGSVRGETNIFVADWKG
jgi:Tol biopolymer transport system component